MPQSDRLNVTVSHGYSRVKRDGRPSWSEQLPVAATPDRGEVTAGKKHTGTDITDKTSPVTTYDYGYDYDPIGNRTGSVV
ncbi:MAG: hypothetical protein RRC34_13340, partial [Lentisphaeria bacterium]|nr:hypothetical protein [Lentisphaeria bacterium]